MMMLFRSCLGSHGDVYTYKYICNNKVYKYICNNKEKEAMNLRGNKGVGYIRGDRWRRGRGNYILTFLIAKRKLMTNIGKDAEIGTLIHCWQGTNQYSR